MDINEKIGLLIAKHRKEKGITQEHLAELTDLHPDYIGKIERGKRSPSVKTLLNLLDNMQLKYSGFFEELEN